jgi:hypothetical protein
MKPEDLDPRLILDQAPALLFSGRPSGYIDYVNRRWLEEIAASLEAVQGPAGNFRAIYRVDVPRKVPLSHFGVSLNGTASRRPTSTVHRRTPPCQES